MTGAFNPVVIPRDGPGDGSLADWVIAASQVLDIQSCVQPGLISLGIPFLKFWDWREVRSADRMVWGHARLAVCSVTCTNILWLQRRRGLQGACLPGESDLQKFLLFMLEIQLLSGDVLAHGPVVCGEIHVILTEIMLFAHLPAVRGNPWGHPPPAHHLMCSEQHLLLHSK